MDNTVIADTLDPVGVIEMPSPEQEAMAERLAEAEFQLRYGSRPTRRLHWSPWSWSR